MIGGILADRLMGARNMVLLGGIIRTLGHMIFGLSESSPFIVYLGLSTLAVGSSFFKGNVINILGDQYSDEKYSDSDRTRGFSLFYISVNIGAILSGFICGYLSMVGYRYAFSVASIGMACGIFTFWRYQDCLRAGSGMPPNPKRLEKTFCNVPVYSLVLLALALVASVILANAFLYSVFMSDLFSYLGIGATVVIFPFIYFNITKEERLKFLLLCGMLLFFMVISLDIAVFTLFIKRNVANTFFGIPIPATWGDPIVSATTILLGVVIDYFDIDINLNKFVSTALLSAVAIFACYVGCYFVDESARVMLFFPFIYFVCGGFIGLFLYSVILSSLSSLSPPKFKGLLTSMLSVMVGISSIFGAKLSRCMVVPEGATAQQSLLIYQSGFLFFTKDILRAIYCIYHTVTLCT